MNVTPENIDLYNRLAYWLKSAGENAGDYRTAAGTAIKKYPKALISKIPIEYPAAKISSIYPTAKITPLLNEGAKSLLNIGSEAAPVVKGIGGRLVGGVAGAVLGDLMFPREAGGGSERDTRNLPISQQIAKPGKVAPSEPDSDILSNIKNMASGAYDNTVGGVEEFVGGIKKVRKTLLDALGPK